MFLTWLLIRNRNAAKEPTQRKRGIAEATAEQDATSIKTTTTKRRQTPKVPKVLDFVLFAFILIPNIQE